MQDAWMIRKAKEIQGYADRNQMKNFFKAIRGPCIKGTAPLLSSDGTTLLTEQSQILKRLAEHFRSVLNCSSAIANAALDRLPQVDTNNDLDLPPSLPETIGLPQVDTNNDLDLPPSLPETIRATNNDLDLPPSLPETIRAVQQISSGKALGSDAIPPEVYKHGGPRLMTELTTLFQEMWRKGQVPQDFKEATFFHLYKRKGNRLHTQFNDRRGNANEYGLFAAACDNFGLLTNTEKTVVMPQPPLNTTYTAAHINVNGDQLKSVDTFMYLGSNLSHSTKVDDEIAHRIAPKERHESHQRSGPRPPMPTPFNMPKLQRIFRAQIGLVGHLRTQCTNSPTIPTNVKFCQPFFEHPTLTPGINSITLTIIETTSHYSSPVTSTTSTAATTTISDGDSLLNCPHCDHTFTSRIGLIGHLRIQRT
ncbi:unnamed protein product [Schistocephalus solidus]|uniref:C2H2-type domain-containing protein n=1 Tax=Schistocephalus solidus TaxID=70667 RepID=A0A183SEI0_SCHSO|nr:unnamed protein product [Schistocephalus solidus]